MPFNLLKTASLPILLFICALLTGCAVSTAAKRTETGLELDLAAEQNKGFVILKVISTRAISVFNPKWQNIRISATGSSTGNDELMDVSPEYNMFMATPIPTESLYFAKLSAGEYQVTGMGSVGPGNGLLMVMLTSDNTSLDKALPKFKVTAGALANLGTIVYVPAIEKEQPERLFLLAGEKGKHAAKQALLAESTRADIPLIEEGGWLGKPLDEATLLKDARPLASMFAVKNTKQGVFAATHLGQVLRRTAPQEWNIEPLDTLDRLFSLAETADGRLVAGAEYGQYFVKNTNEQWRAYRLPNESGRVVTVVPRADSSAFFVVTNGKSSRVLMKKSLESESEIPVEVHRINDLVSNSLVTDNEIIFAQNIAGISRQSSLTRVNMQTLKTSVTTEKFWVAGWQHLPDGTVKLSRQNGMSLYATTSTDNLQTWTHSDGPGAMSQYWFDSANGLSFEMGSGFIMVDNNLGRSSDGGKTWVRTGNPLKTRIYPGHIIFADDKEVLVQGSHMIYSTVDNGQNWKRSFPQ